MLSSSRMLSLHVGGAGKTKPFSRMLWGFGRGKPPSSTSAAYAMMQPAILKPLMGSSAKKDESGHAASEAQDDLGLVLPGLRFRTSSSHQVRATRPERRNAFQTPEKWDQVAAYRLLGETCATIRVPSKEGARKVCLFAKGWPRSCASYHDQRGQSKEKLSPRQRSAMRE